MMHSSLLKFDPKKEYQTPKDPIFSMPINIFIQPNLLVGQTIEEDSFLQTGFISDVSPQYLKPGVTRVSALT